MQNSYNPEPTEEWSLKPHFYTIHFNIVFYFGRHPASCTMGTGSFAGVKAVGAWADHQSPSSAEVLS